LVHEIVCTIQKNLGSWVLAKSTIFCFLY
jgi:hypothetical protein